jgi:nucleotide-binding universal stress UspA family protein
MREGSEEGEDEMNRIVVGIDGSAESKRALRWAVAEAKLRGAALRVVHAWMFPYTAAGPGLDPMLDAQVIDDVRRSAEGLVERELAELGDEAAGVDIERAVVEGAPAPTLIEAAQGSDLLVVGSRGHGGFSGLLLGSVGQQCSHHAPCPLVIVRARTD